MADEDNRDLAAGAVGRRLGVGAAAQFTGIAVQQVAKFATNWLIARMLGASALGLFSLSLTFWSSVQMSFSGGLIRTIMRYLPHHISRQEGPEAAGILRLNMLTAWIGGAILAALMYWGADPLAVHVLDKPEAAESLRIMALAMPLAAVSGVAWATARSLGSFTFIIYQFMLLPVAFAALIPLVAVMRGQAGGLAWAFGASYALPLIPLMAYYRRLTAFLPRPRVTPVVRAAASFFAIACLMWFAEYVARNIDLLLVGRLRTTAEAGVYTIAQRTSTLPAMVLVAFNAFFSPTVSALYATRRLDELRATFRRTSLWILIVSAPVLGLLMSLATPVMRLFGDEFTDGALALWILCLGQFVNVGVGLVDVVLTMADRQRTVLYANIGGVLVSGLLCLLLIPTHGITGAAAASSVFLVVVPAALCVLAYRELGVSPLSQSYLKPVLATIGAGVATSWATAMLPGVAAQLLAGGALFVALYGGLMVAMGEGGEASRALRALRDAAQRRSRPAPPPDPDAAP